MFGPQKNYWKFNDCWNVKQIPAGQVSTLGIAGTRPKFSRVQVQFPAMLDSLKPTVRPWK